MKKNHTSVASLKLLDSVALLKDLPDDRLIKGQVGTIVEELDEGGYEVEFADKQGRTIASLALTVEELMLLHFEAETTG
jgi:hypothetical protein